MLKLERYRALAAHHIRASQATSEEARKIHLSMATSWAALATREQKRGDEIVEPETETGSPNR